MYKLANLRHATAGRKGRGEGEGGKNRNAETYLGGHAKLLLDGASVAVKVPVCACHHPHPCGLVLLHNALHTQTAHM